MQYFSLRLGGPHPPRGPVPPWGGGGGVSEPLIDADYTDCTDSVGARSGLYSPLRLGARWPDPLPKAPFSGRIGNILNSRLYNKPGSEEPGHTSPVGRWGGGGSV